MEFRRLTTRFLLIVLALFVAVALISTASLLVAVNGIVKKLGTSFAIERAEVERSRIAEILDREAILARKLADSPSLQHWLLDESNPALKAAAFEELESFRRAFRDANWFVAVDSSKRYYNRTSSGDLAVTTLDMSSPADAWYPNTIAEGRDSSFNLDYDALIGKMQVFINCISRWNGKVIGIAGTGIDITDLIAQILRPDRAGVSSMLIDGAGAVTAHPDRSFVEQNALARASGKKVTIFDLATTPADRAKLNKLMDAALTGKPSADTVSLQGHSALTVVALVPDIGWMAVVTVDSSSAISVLDFLPLFVLLVAALLAVLVTISILMDRVVLRPLAAMTVSARRIAAGDYESSRRPGERTRSEGLPMPLTTWPGR